MNVKLPTLPQVPDGGRGRLVVDIPYTGPETVQTRLGSIPRDYETGTGRERTEDFYFPENGPKEAENRYGSRREIWRPIPTLKADGSVKMVSKTAHIEAAPKSKIWTTLKWGVPATAIGGAAGAVVGLVFGDAATGAKIGAGVVGLAGAALGYSDAAGDRVKLEWRNLPIQDYELVGYRLEVDEDEDCDSDGNCDSDYEHDFRPLFRTEELDSYYMPVVVHYKDGCNKPKK